ncbi:MAG: D-arabinono-1,4-lactone oxidase [Polyangiaceae bacterium]
MELPRSVDELQAIVRRANRLRAVGSAHSWSLGVVTEDTVVSLDGMREVVAIDPSARLATVQAGIKLKELIAALDRRGLALANLGSIAEQSLAGAISTGTHGSGIAFRCLADQVQSLSLVDGRGDVVRVDRGHPDFDAIAVGLGCFGVVHEITLSVVPAFQMHAITDTASFDEVIENLDAFVHGFDHFKLWWLVPGDTAIVFTHDRTNAPRDDGDLASRVLRAFKDEFLSVAVYRSLLALERLDRRRLVPAVNRLLGAQVGKRFERVCQSHVGFLTPSPPVHREAEWAFDLAGAKALLRGYRRLLLESGHTFNFIQEIRFTRGDDFWMSPAHGRDTIWLSLYNIDSEPRWDDQLRRFEAFAREHGGRPHWGKEARFDPTYLASQYPRFADFGARMRAYDPGRKLANRWVDGIFGS